MSSSGGMLTVVIFGATGDLARKKLFPALYELLYGCPEAPLLPASTRIVGFGRARVELGDFLATQCAGVTGARRLEFLSRISYFQGQYDQEADFARLHTALLDLEVGSAPGNRLFFLVGAANGVRSGLRERSPAGMCSERLYPLGHREALRPGQPELRRAQQRDVELVSRGPIVPHRSLLGKGEGVELVGVPVCQPALRAIVEPRAHRSGADCLQGGHRHMREGRLL
mmetsp:Transcript_46756/g.134670  ORF Transcript_46756/g.134670 Transcript_46756/m.134670 type:complete len:227 (-) Transcript_46756:1082-1762(-)